MREEKRQRHERSSDGRPSLEAYFPRNSASAHHRGDVLSNPLLNHRSHGTSEPHAVIGHRVAPNGKHDAAPVAANRDRPVGHGPITRACHSTGKCDFRFTAAPLPRRCASYCRPGSARSLGTRQNKRTREHYRRRRSALRKPTPAALQPGVQGPGRSCLPRNRGISRSSRTGTQAQCEPAATLDRPGRR